jgi:hypothetical protein
MSKPSANSYLTLLKTLGRTGYNKGLAFGALGAAVHFFNKLPQGPGASVPFSELFYGGILILAILATVPVVRLIFFAEAAEYAELGKLREDIGMVAPKEGVLRHPAKFTPALVHYWYATTVSFLITVAAALAMQGTGL